MEAPSVIKQTQNMVILYVQTRNPASTIARWRVLCVLTIYWGGNGDMAHNTGVIHSPDWGEGVVHRGDMGADPSFSTINNTLPCQLFHKICRFMMRKLHIFDHK